MISRLLIMQLHFACFSVSMCNMQNYIDKVNCEKRYKLNGRGIYFHWVEALLFGCGSTKFSDKQQAPLTDANSYKLITYLSGENRCTIFLYTIDRTVM